MTKDTEIADLRKDLIGALRNQAVDTSSPPEVKTVDPYQKWKESVVKWEDFGHLMKLKKHLD